MCRFRQVGEATRVAIEASVRIFREAKPVAPICEPLAAILNQSCLDLAGPKDERVLVFIGNSRKGLKTGLDMSTEEPGLIGFFVRRGIAAERSISGGLKHGDPDWAEVPPAEELICVVECTASEDADTQCKWYRFVPSRHRLGSSIQYGFATDRSVIRLISLGLEERGTWPEIKWTELHCVDKLCELLKLVLDEAKRVVPPSVPKLNRVLRCKKYTFGMYTASIGGKLFLLLPIFSGREDGRKTFVALGAERHHQKEARIFKYSWRKKGEHDRERRILEKLVNVPGVVQMDSGLSQDAVDTDEASGGERNLLVMNTIGSPLCSCESVKAFLEAMYDLLEVVPGTDHVICVRSRDVVRDVYSLFQHISL